MLCKQSSSLLTSLFLLWQNFNPLQLHPTFTHNCPWRKVTYRVIIDLSLELFLCLKSKVLGVEESECWLLSPSLSTIKYKRTWISLRITPTRGPSVWGNPQTTIKPFILGPLSHHTPSCFNQVCEAFPLFYISWINSKICHPLPVPLVLSWEVPVPSVGSTRLLWFLTGVTWKCTAGTH